MSDQHHLPDPLPEDIDAMLDLLGALPLDELSDEEFLRLETHLEHITAQLREENATFEQHLQDLDHDATQMLPEKHQKLLAALEARLTARGDELISLRLGLYIARLHLRIYTPELYAHYGHFSGGTANPNAHMFDNNEPLNGDIYTLL